MAANGLAKKLPVAVNSVGPTCAALDASIDSALQVGPARLELKAESAPDGRLLQRILALATKLPVAVNSIGPTCAAL